MLLVTCLVTLYCMCTGSCHQDKFLVCASILGNKALSDSDSDLSDFPSLGSGLPLLGLALMWRGGLRVPVTLESDTVGSSLLVGSP